MLVTANFVLEDTPELDGFNHWYSTIHVADFIEAPGVVSGRRFYRRLGDKIHFVAAYEHDGSVHARETFRSAAASSALADFNGRFPHIEEPAIVVFHEIPVGSLYEGWRSPADHGSGPGGG